MFANPAALCALRGFRPFPPIGFESRTHDPSRLMDLSRESVVGRSLLNYVAVRKEHRDRLRATAARLALYDAGQVAEFIDGVALEAVEMGGAHLRPRRGEVVQRLRDTSVVNPERAFESFALVPKARWDDHPSHRFAKPRGLVSGG